MTALIIFALLGAVETGELNKGLVGHWPMDTESKGAAALLRDASVYGTELTLYNSPVVSSDGTAFDGVDQKAQADIQNFRGSDNVGTIAGWVRVPDASSTLYMFASAEQVTSNGTYLYIAVSNGTLIAVVRNAADTADIAQTSAIISGNTWYHVAVTSNGSRWLIFVDGVSKSFTMDSGVDQGRWLNDIGGGGRDNVTVGSLIRITSSYGVGSVFDVRYYSRELSTTEIAYLYDQGRRIVGLETGGLYKGLVGYWPLDTRHQASSTTMRNASVYGPELTLVASPTVASDGTTFNGTTQYATATVDGYRSGDSLGSICMWVTQTGSAADILLESSDTATGNFRFSFQTNTGGTYRLGVVEAGVTEADIETDAGGYNDGNWHYVCITSNGSRYLFYVDGASVAFSVNAGADNGDWFSGVSNRDNLTFAAATTTSTFGWLTGSIGYPRIHDRELSATEIGYHYAQGPRVVGVETGSLSKGLVGSWVFDTDHIGSATVARDLTPYGNECTAMGTPPTFTATGTSAFNGSSDYLDCGDADEFSFTDGAGTDKPFTACVWANLSDATTQILVTKDNQAANREWQLLINGADKPVVAILNGANFIQVTADNTVTSLEGSYALYCATYDGSEADTGIAIYVNAEAQSTTTATGGTYTGMANTAQPVYVGRRAAVYSSGAFFGPVLYDRELSATEIGHLYSYGRRP